MIPEGTKGVSLVRRKLLPTSQPKTERVLRKGNAGGATSNLDVGNQCNTITDGKERTNA